MDTEEAHPEAAAILREAGWKPHDQWGVYTRGTLVMGLSPDGQSFDVKNTATAPDGPDTPDDPVEAAHWLVRLRAPAVVVDDVVSYAAPAEAQSLFGEPAEAAYGGEDETHGETGESAQYLADDQLLGGGGDSDQPEDQETADIPAAGVLAGDAPAGDGVNADPRSADWRDAESDERADDFTDADFAPIEDEPPERDALDADLIPLRGIAWDENTVADELGAEILDEGQAPQDRFIGLDDLDRRRSLRIGDVVRVSRAKQEAIWAASGTTEDAYQDLVSAVMRDTINGVYTGPATQFDQFTALQAWANQAHAVARAERGFVAYLTDATREQVESFNPEVGWP